MQDFFEFSASSLASSSFLRSQKLVSFLKYILTGACVVVLFINVKFAFQCLILTSAWCKKLVEKTRSVKRSGRFWLLFLTVSSSHKNSVRNKVMWSIITTNKIVLVTNYNLHIFLLDGKLHICIYTYKITNYVFITFYRKSVAD